jgi:hypothetical protein
MSKRVTPQEAAQELSWSVGAMEKSAKRHGYKKGADGKWDMDELRRAKLAGMEMNKNREEKLAADEQPGTLTQARLAAQIEKLKIEIQMLRLELDESEKKLVNVADAVAIVTRRESEMATRLRVWSESEAAKRPDLAEAIHGAAARLADMMREPVGL